MAATYGNTTSAISSNPYRRQQQLLALITQVCEPRQRGVDSDLRRLLVDPTLDWAAEPIDGNLAWIYLPRATRLREVAGCLVLTAD